MAITLYHNGQVFLGARGSEPEFAEAFIVDGDTILFVGTEADAREAAAARTDAASAETHAGAETRAGTVVEVDLGGRLVLPGFVDGHAHILGTGEALARVPLTDARDLKEIQSRLAAARAADPHAERILGRGWLFDSVPGGAPTAAMIDEVVADVPVYLDANDYHSCWVNSAALREMGIDRSTPNPVGGEIERDANGDATGMLFETAAGEFAWNHLDDINDAASEDEALDRVFAAYLEAGVTSAVDMGLNEVDLAAFDRALNRHNGELPINVIAHWRINNAGDRERNLSQVDRAIDLAAAGRPSGLRVAGIKCIIDGTIDACTAAMSEPYTNGRNSGPIWPLADLEPVVVAADAAGLQIALHAIGDEAIDIAISALETAARVNGDKPRRHRIEHLEYAAPGTAERLAELGITASMQPVHTDAAIRDNWNELLGAERSARGFAWPEYEDAGALLAFSTDTPTAPHEALPNLYIATTRKSALDPSCAANEPELAVSLGNAVLHATRDAAIAAGEGDRRGELRAGFAADFAVVEDNPFALGVEALREGRVSMTVVGGQVVHGG